MAACALLAATARAAEPEPREDPLALASGGLAATNTAERRCAAAGYFLKHPGAAGDAVLADLAGMLGDERRVILSESGFAGGLPGSPAGEAARALEAIGAKAVGPLLSSLAATNAGVRCRATRALGRIADARALPAIAGLVADADRSVSLAASDALVGYGAPAVALMRGHLDGPSPANADRAIWVLGELRDADSVPLFMKFISSDDDRARLAAGAALSKLGVSGARLLLDQWPDADEAGREKILVALEKIGTPDARDHLVATALADRSARLRRAALRGMPGWNDAISPVAMMCALRDENADNRDQVRAGFKLMGAGEAVRLAPYLESAHPVVWQSAAIAISSMSPEAAAPLFAMLRDVNRPRETRRRVAWVLLNMTGVKARYEDSQRLWIAAEDWQLLSVFTEGIPEPLAEAARSSHADYRAGALAAMSSLKLRGTEGYLFAALDDPDPDVVMAARRGLAGFGYAWSAQLEDLVQHGGVRASRAAAATLADIGYRPHSQAMLVEYHASRGAVDRLLELGGLVPTHLERRLERCTEPAEVARLALHLSVVLPMIQPDDRFAVDNVMVRAALVGTNRPARLEAMKEIRTRANLMLALALDKDTNVAAAARQELAALPGNARELLTASLRSGEPALTGLALSVLPLVEAKQLAGFDPWLRLPDRGTTLRVAGILAAAGHRPAAPGDRLALAVLTRDWADAVAQGGAAAPALRAFLATADAADLPGLCDALAGADAPELVDLLADVHLARQGAVAEELWPALERAGPRLRARLVAQLRAGGLVEASHAARLLGRLKLAPGPEDPDRLLYCAASGRTRDLDDLRDRARDALVREARREEADRRLRGAVWLTLLQREPEREAIFTTASLVRDYTERLERGDAQAKAEAAVLLSQLGTNAAPAVPALIRALSDTTRMSYRGASGEAFASLNSPAEAAALALGEIGAAAADELLKLWDDAATPEAVKLAAARAIALVRDPRCAAAHLALVERETRRDVRLAAMKALTLSDPGGSVRPLLQAAAQSDDPLVVGAALKALRATGPETTPKLVVALHDENSAVQELALSLLAARREPKAFDAAVRLARGGFPGVRSEAAKYFGGLGEPRGVQTLIELLADSSMIVQWNACESLSIIGRPAVEKLVEAMPAANAEQRVRMAMVLRSITGENLGTNAADWRAWLKK